MHAPCMHIKFYVAREEPGGVGGEGEGEGNNQHLRNEHGLDLLCH